MPCRETATLHMPQHRLGDETLMRGLMGMVENSRVPLRDVAETAGISKKQKLVCGTYQALKKKNNSCQKGMRWAIENKFVTFHRAVGSWGFLAFIILITKGTFCPLLREKSPTSPPKLTLPSRHSSGQSKIFELRTFKNNAVSSEWAKRW